MTRMFWVPRKLHHADPNRTQYISLKNFNNIYHITIIVSLWEYLWGAQTGGQIYEI